MLCRNCVIAVGLWMGLAYYGCYAGDLKIVGGFQRVLLVANPHVTNEFQFEALISGCSYRFTVFPKGGQFRRGHEELAFDGKDSYRLFYGNSVPIDAIDPEHPVDVNGFITEPRIPSIGPTYMIYAWFPFLAKCYLLTEPKGRVTCEFIKPDTFGKCRQPAEIRYKADNSDVIDEMILFHTGLETRNDQKEHRLPFPFENGYRQLVYRTGSVQKFGDASIPNRFEWVLYDPRPNATASNELAEVWRIYGSVDKVENDFGGESIVPEPRTKTAIFDHRLDSVSKIKSKPYFASEFIQPFDARYKQLIQERIAIEKIEDNSHLLTRGPALILYVVALASVGLFVFRKSKVGTAPN
jgi:hypothetical protein